MSERNVTLEEWLALHYSKPPSILTARRWCREGRIYPTPEKHGRSYYLRPDARYIDLIRPDRLNGATPPLLP